ncbi:hypothetical protein J6590_018178 [Homalodisca vitripennis]|nr:hypothetical protein J6590_018178 [Homalodisca vitripennis]
MEPGEDGIILLDSTGEESSTDVEELDPPSPCDVTFVGDNVLINGKSNLKKSPKQVKKAVSRVPLLIAVGRSRAPLSAFLLQIYFYPLFLPPLLISDIKRSFSIKSQRRRSWRTGSIITTAIIMHTTCRFVVLIASETLASRRALEPGGYCLCLSRVITVNYFPLEGGARRQVEKLRNNFLYKHSLPVQSFTLLLSSFQYIMEQL